MTIRCGACGQFIAYGDDFITDYEPLSHFGPEVIDFVHRSCAQVDRSRNGQDREDGLDAQHESAVAKRCAQPQ